MRWIFLLLPWIELFTLIQLGGRIGALQALFYVFLTVVIGFALLRAQGMEIINRLRAAENGQLIPPNVMVDEVAVGLAALLLIIPGLVTDALALVVLLGPLRRRLFALFGAASRPQVDREAMRSGGDSIEGEFRRLDED